MAQCSATARSGKQCRRKAIPGGKVCRYHGGAAPQVVKAAEMRVAKTAAINEAERMVARAGVDAHPLDHLLESLHRAAALVEVWGRMVADIDAKAAVEMEGDVRGELGYVEVDDEDSYDTLRVEVKDRLMGLDHKGQASVHPYVHEYNQALERRAKFAKMCLDAGIEERRVKLAEEQGQMVVKVISTILDDLKVKRTTEVNKIIGKALRQIEPQYG